MAFNLSIKKISLYGSLMALLAELIALVSFVPLKGRLLAYNIFELLTPALNLRYLNLRIFYESNNQTGLIVNYLDLAFYLLFVAGAIFYINSKGKETRLLRFSYSVILLVKSIGFLTFVHHIIKGYGSQFSDDHKVLFLLFALLNILVWGYLSFRLLQMLSATKQLDKEVLKFEDGNRIKYVATNKAQRIVHHTLDIFLSVIICSKFVMVVFYKPLVFLSDILTERFAMYVLIIITLVIYRVFFEAIFGATPMKFLTESRVLTLEGKKIGFKTALLRSLTRHVPFEALSYLGSGNGWHDEWNHTMVVKEKQEGVNTGKYLWILPAFLVLGLLSYVGYEMNYRHQNYLYQKGVHEANIADIKQHLDRFDKNYVIEIKEANKNYSSDKYYLRADTIVGGQIHFVVFDLEESFPTVKEIEEGSYHKQNLISSIVLTKEILLESFTEDYRDFKNRKRKGFAFLNDNVEYYITNIYPIHSPHLRCRGTGGLSRDGMSMGMINDGSVATLIAIENIDGDLEWENELPQHLVTAEDTHQQTFTLSANNFKRGVVYKFRLVVRDNYGKEYKYLMEQINMDEKFTQIFEGDEYY